MKLWTSLVATLLIASVCQASDVDKTGADTFIRQVVQSLVDDQHIIAFEVADKVFAIDNGEVLSKADLAKAWPSIGKQAFKTKVSVGQFFRDVTVQVYSPLENKRLMSNKRVLQVYKPEPNDLYCDASHVKNGVDNFIGYDKAFIFIIRKVQGKWTLVGMGG